MNQLILRIKSNSEDVEILNKDSNDKEIFTSVSKKECLEIINREFKEEAFINERFVFVDNNIIAFSNNSVVIKQDEHKRIVTLNGKAYKISFPNAIYIIRHNDNKIMQIKAFCFKKYKGLNTELYRYPMPNMLSDNNICIGSAKRKIIDNDFMQALENIIYAEYTHLFFSDLKSFKNSVEYFDYLSQNEFPYDLMISANMNLRSIINIKWKENNNG